jgi:uncharacterized protein (TIGR00369 family)
MPPRKDDPIKDITGVDARLTFARRVKIDGRAGTEWPRPATERSDDPCTKKTNVEYQMDLACSEMELEQLLAEVAFTKNLGFALSSIGDGECSISVPFQDAFERPGGIVSGQVFMAAADVAMWLAIKTKLGLADSSVTAEMKTNFLGAAKQEGFLCTAKILKVGRRLIYGIVECVDSTGRLLTHSTVTYIRSEK